MPQKLLAKVLRNTYSCHRPDGMYIEPGEIVELFSKQIYYSGGRAVYIYKCKGQVTTAPSNLITGNLAPGATGGRIEDAQCIPIRDVQLLTSSKFIDIDLIKSLSNSKGFIRTHRNLC